MPAINSGMYKYLHFIFSLLFALFVLIPNTSLFAQKSKFDSLQLCINVAKSDSAKVRLLLKIGDFFEYSNPDSALIFYEKTLTFAQKISNRYYEAKTFLHMGSLVDNKGDFNNALDYFLKAEKIGKKENLITILCACYNDIGRVYFNQGDFPKAIDYFQKSLQGHELIAANEANHKLEKYVRPGDAIKGICGSHMNIGVVHYELGNYDQAWSYYSNSKKIYEEFICSNDLGKIRFGKLGLGKCYNNMGNVKMALYKYPEAIELYQKSMGLKKDFNDKQGISLCYNNIGNVYSEMGSYILALDCFKKSVDLYEELADKNGLALVLANITGLNNLLADSVAKTQTEKNKYLKEAIQSGTRSYELAKEIGAVPLMNEAAENLRIAYKKLENFKKYIEFSDIYIETRDSMFQEEKTRSITEMETKYQSEKKQMEIEKQHLQISKKDAEIKEQLAVSGRQKMAIILVAVFLLFVIALLFVLYRLFLQKKKSNQIILLKNKDLEQANEEIRTQRDEIEQQRDIVMVQKREIEVIHGELKDSIHYAKRIQQAVLPTTEYLSEFISEYFVFSRPKDIVSGDFYWITKVDNWSLFCVADCTGHGVPGAIMSMLGIALLNEIVRNKETTQASHVLDQLKKRMIEALQQRGISGEQQDGMDMAFCALNADTFEMHFAGANNPVWIVEVCHGASQQPGLTELKGDKMPIGIHDRMTLFTNQIYQLQKGDIIYLMSDGFEDQFGGPNQKKYMTKNLKNLLTTNCQKPMATQKEMLEKSLADWMGNYDQIDDITVMGIKI